MFVVVFVFTWTVNAYLSLNSTAVVAHFTSFKLFDFCQNLVHYCSIYLCSLDVGNIDNQCRGPSIKEKDHLAG